MTMNENTVELVGWYGGDREHALAAWTSTSRELTPEKEARIPALLQMLAEGSDGNPHGTPFERSLLHFLVVVDTATHIQILRHRVGMSPNVESARYKELKDDKFLLPNDWPDTMRERLAGHMDQSYRQYHQAIKELQASGLSRKRAKESARYFLPYANQVTMDLSFNFRSFVHFLKLRATRGAQEEIWDVADEMLRLVREIPGHPFEHSLAAWGF